ncbi:unnamed protein product [Ranitomeya imitator]|uniref:beta-glucosidase n=1 Tax=Ranitomeya imitator TaxID=111125 RepID=A0ABN9LAA2_9NEOB|nr:unnamed protein product [Ranitomeya imitator]
MADDGGQQPQLLDKVRQEAVGKEHIRSDQSSRKSSSRQGSRASTGKEPPRVPVPFSLAYTDAAVDTWDKAPKLDAAVAKASKKAALPFEDMGSLKDPLDRKADTFLKDNSGTGSQHRQLVLCERSRGTAHFSDEYVHIHHCNERYHVTAHTRQAAGAESRHRRSWVLLPPEPATEDGGRRELLRRNSTGVHAILECFFPAQAAGMAIAKVLTGAEGANPGGRLPATWPAGMDQVPAMENYTMNGRTYRYYGNQIPLYPFGYGLSYTTFQYSDLVVTPILKLCETLDLSVQVKNSGLRTGDEVIQVYMSWSNAAVPVPRWQLVGVQRVTIPQSGSVKFSLSVLPRQRAIWTNYWILEPGKFSLYVGGQQPFQVTKVPSNVLQASFTVQGEARPLNTC